MKTYTTNRPNTKRYIINQLLIIVCLLMVLIICEYLYPESGFFKKPNYLLWGILIPLAMFFEIKKERVIEISFDHDKQMISFSYKTSAFSKLKSYDLAYGLARVERNKNTALVNWFGPAPIYFSKNKLELFEVSKRKDGFSKEALDDIYNTCLQIYLEQKNFQTAI